jgi:hypothetical protein
MNKGRLHKELSCRHIKLVFPLRTGQSVSMTTRANATLTSGGITLFMGDMGEGALHRDESNCQTKKLKSEESNCHSNVTSGHALQKGQETTTNWPTDRRS